MDRIRLGFVGTGGMGQCAHLRNYATLEGCEVVALAELRPQLARQVAARYGIPTFYTDYREMLEREKLDALVAIQPFTAHGQLLPDLLTYRLPTLIEKPLARSVAVGEAVLEAAQRHGTPLYLAYHKRSDPATRFACEQIASWRASGAMGDLRYVRITMPPGDWSAAGFSTLVKSDEPYPPLVHDPPAPDGDAEWAKRYDAFVNYYIHQVNLLRHLLGEEYHVAYADPSQVVMAARSDSGVTALLEMQPYRTTLEWQESALIAFEKGWIRLDLPAPLVIDRPGAVTVYSDPGGTPPTTLSPSLPPIHAMRQQATHFLQAVRGAATCLCGPEEALEDLRIARDYINLLNGQRKP